ncbi:Dexh-box atp-dependent rna helicase dexh6 [Thalictrum thalictroides]|uniref:Dexh-box atp-dependent rna helicase dexh6 n=1 Tax=Thalictrum thalictroides TaxID=46969 RepID=A0A7J6VRX8_THATH|nr:Dexh-box atp-dependent rna helicase dexh6 [Thalictrum thalictroides]
MTRSGKNKKNGKQEANPKVVEAARIRIVSILEDFINGNEGVYTFDAGLTNPERAVVHELCKKKGMKSKSSGRGNQRRVSVYKSKISKRQTGEKLKNVSCLKFSEESNKVLRDLFTRYPPSDGEHNEEKVTGHVNEVYKRLRTKDDSFRKPSMNKAEIARKVEGFNSRMNKAPNLRQIFNERSKLPIASFKDAITSTIETNQVVLISGETGCGKTTQVPQYLLDYMWGKGEVCKIVCTQPRRISATSVAERIAYERGENVGDNIGYKIRLENKGGMHSSIMFCTNGLLLRVLVGKGTSTSSTNITSKDGAFEVTHIIVDEIHERDRFSDLMLAILRDMLPLYPHLRLILMSATIDSERFSQYFGGCPVIRVPGFTYPVKSFYLEDILSVLKSAESNHLDSTSPDGIREDAELTEDYIASLDEAINMAVSSDEFDPLLELISSESTPRICNYQHSLTGASPLMVCAGKGRVSDVCMLLSLGANCNLSDKGGKSAMEWAQQENQREIVEIIRQHLENVNSKSADEQELLEKYLATVNPEHIDIILIERLLRKICTDSEEGAILIFLPGWDDINKTREKLLDSPFFKDTSKFVVIPLHSMVPSAEQKKVFKRLPRGIRKIILSTNIAETAVTIDDVVYVIDSGRMKEKNYDPYNDVSTLHSSWVSKASAKQREGRAGRCQPGICYHLFSKTRAASLPEFQVPEIKRMPIEELCLQVKMLNANCKIVDFLQKTLDPPVSETIRNAILVLQGIGALSPDEDLTELGEKLGSLPVHPSTSKMLFFAILMNCLDPALTLACAADYRDPFILPMAPLEKKKALTARAELASLYGGHSDQLMVIAAYECWKRAKDKGQEASFCSKYYVSSSTMRMLSSMRMQLKKELIRNGFMEEASYCSLNARDPGILQAVVVAGLYPMVGRLLPPHKSGQRCVIETISGAKVRLHPHSSNYKLSVDKSSAPPLVVFDEITRGDGGMYIRNCSVVGPYPLLIIAADLVVAPAEDNAHESDEDCDASGSDEDGMEVHTVSSEKREQRIMSAPDNTVSVVIDRWLTFESTALDVAQIYCLRERLHEAILFKVKYPKKVLPPALGASMCAIACILSYDGLSGISPSCISVGSSTLMMNAVGIDKSYPDKENETLNLDSDSYKFLSSLMSDSTPHRSHPDKPQQVSRRLYRNATTNPNMQQTYLQTGGHPSQITQLHGPGLGVHHSGGQPKVTSSKRRRGAGP